MRTKPSVIAAVFLALAVAAPAASGATFYVDGSVAASANPCTSPAARCKTINTALAQSHGPTFTRPDTIQIAQGVYTEAVDLDQQDQFVTINGGGISNVISGGTTIVHPNGASVAALSLVDAEGVTVRDLRVTVPDGAAASKRAIVLEGEGTRLEDVEAQMQNPSNEPGILVLRKTTLDRVRTIGDADWTGPGVMLGNISSATIRDSLLESGEGQALLANAAKTVLVQRSILRRAGSLGTTASLGAETSRLVSSLVLGGHIGVGVNAGSGQHQFTIDNTTIDSGTPGFSDDPADALDLRVTGDGDTTYVAGFVRSSILVDRQQVLGTNGALVDVACESSDVPFQTQLDPLARLACGATDGNTSSTPGTLFVNAPIGDYRLKPGSPAVDSGHTDPPADFESPTDLNGQPRVLDGNLDCVVRRDRGARELTGQSNTPPAAAIAGPGSATPGAAIGLTGSATDEDPPSALIFAWSFSDGFAAAGPDVSHPFAAAGAQEAKLTVTDTHGCTGTAVHPLAIAAEVAEANAAPSLTGVSISNPRFRVAAAAATRKLAPAGTRFRHTLSEPATIGITLERALPGRRAGRRCVKPTRANRRRARCTRYVRAGVMRSEAEAGRKSTSFSGRLGRKALRPGAYRALLVATDAAGARSATRRVTFRVVAR